MAKYTALDNQTGKKITFQWDGETPPTDSDMEDVFTNARQMSEVPSAIPPVESKSPIWRAAQAVAPYARPALEMGGALAGAAISAPGNVVAPGLASLAGAGLGYAGGRQIANALDEYSGYKKPSTLSEAMTSTALAIPEGMAMEAGGAIANKAILAGLSKVAKAAPRIYESIAKIPPRSVDKSTRDKAVKTALEKEIVPNEKGFKKLGGMIDATNEKISGIIKDAEDWTRNAVQRNAKSGLKEYEEGKLSIPDILRRLESVREWAYKSYADPAPVLKLLKEYKQGISRLRGKEISVESAQKLKQGIYRRLSDSAYGEYSTPSKEMDKAFARGIKEELVKKFPILQKLNSDDSALINLSNVLEGTVNRTRNWDIAGMSDIAGSGVGALAGGSGGDLKKGGEGAAIGFMVARALRSPAIMSRVAFALNKASKVGGAPLTARAASYGTIGKGVDKQKEDIKNLSPLMSNAFSSTEAEANGTLPTGHMQDLGQDRSPASPDIRNAMEAYVNGNFEGTIKALTSAIGKDPQLADAYKRMLYNLSYEQKKTNDLIAKKNKKI